MFTTIAGTFLVSPWYSLPQLYNKPPALNTFSGHNTIEMFTINYSKFTTAAGTFLV